MSVKISDPLAALRSFSKFGDANFRVGQDDVIRKIVESKKPFVVVEAPTGSGKTILGMVGGMMSGGMTYMTHSKILQNQVTDDFPEAVSLFGRGNYTCKARPRLDCSMCLSGTGDGELPVCEYKKGTCAYEIAKRAALASSMKILNYDYFMYESNYVGKFSGLQLGIVDEADNLENALVGFTSLRFSEFAFSKLELDGPARKTAGAKGGIDSWVDFVRLARKKAVVVKRGFDRAAASFGSGTSLSDGQVKMLRSRDRVGSLISQIDMFLKNVDSGWMYDDQQDGQYIFRPVWLTAGLSGKYMWEHGKKWVLMSASFLPVHLLARTLGISVDDIEYIQMESSFPVDRRPIHMRAVCNLTRDTMAAELPKLCNEIRRILNEHRNEKGIVHCVSYSLGKAIVEGVGDNRLCMHGSGNRQEALDRFIGSDDPMVLVSPSMERGVSLDYDKARFVIVAKAPYLSLADKVVRARIYGSGWGQKWYTANMLLTVLQMAGRGMRAADDYCDTYILDRQFENALVKNAAMLPLWWREAIV